MQLRLTAPAKINLGLDVLDKRSDGYHNIQTVMQTISLYDYIVIRPADKGIRLECDSPGIPAGEENLAYQAARLILGRAGSQQSVCIYLKKGIPPAAGLGGGSSDAATVLKGINTIMGLHLSEGELIDMGGTIGADVPFFISGGTAFAQGKGDKLTQLTSFKGMDILLIKPHFELSTASVYHQFDSCRPEKRPDMNSILEAVRNKDMDSLGKRIYNVLEGSLETRWNIS